MPSSVLPLHIQDADVPDSKGPALPNSALSNSALPNSARTGLSALSAQSQAVQNLDVVLAELRQANHEVTHLYEGDDEDTDDEGEKDDGRIGWSHKINHFRAELRHFLHIPAFHYTIICLVIFDLVVVFIDLVISLLNLPCYTDEQLDYFQSQGITDIPQPANCKLQESTALTDGDWFLWALSVFLLSIFELELFAALFAFGPKHFKKPIYAIDAFIVTASLILEVYFKVGDGGRLEDAPSAIIALRLWKVVRAVHAIAHSIELKNQEIIKRVKQAKQEVEDEYKTAIETLEREQLKLTYLLDQAPHVQEHELDQYVEKEIRERNEAEAAEAEAEESLEKEKTETS